MLVRKSKGGKLFQSFDGNSFVVCISKSLRCAVDEDTGNLKAPAARDVKFPKNRIHFTSFQLSEISVIPQPGRPTIL